MLVLHEIVRFTGLSVLLLPIYYNGYGTSAITPLFLLTPSFPPPVLSTNTNSSFEKSYQPGMGWLLVDCNPFNSFFVTQQHMVQ